MRPSFGTISKAGVTPLAPSFDTVGFLAKSYETLEKVASTLLSAEIPPEPDVGNIYLVKEAFALSDQEVCKALNKSISELSTIFWERLRKFPYICLLKNSVQFPFIVG